MLAGMSIRATLRFRFMAAILLAVMLPIQGWAAACAQICALAQQGIHAAVTTASVSDSQPDDADHCSKHDQQPGKCCQAHVFVAELPLPPQAISFPSFERTYFVARWTNFIPEEPSPPPIVSAIVD